jgi:hypothetical protein
MFLLTTMITWAVVPQSSTLHYKTIFPSVMLPSFGFQANGTFDISITSPDLRNFVILFQHPHDSLHISAMRPKRLLYFCDGDLPNSSKSLQISAFGSDGRGHVNGTLRSDGVYSPYLINCDANHSTYDVNVTYSNPTSHLDSRNMFLGPLYQSLSVIYLGFAIAWILNGCRFSNFRVHLHTVLTVMPIIRALSSLFISWIWKDRAATGKGSSFENIVFVLDFIYYTLYLSTIAFVGMGWCIFRGSPDFSQVSKILSSSLMPTLGVLLIPFARDFIAILGVLALLVLGLMLYARINVYNIILVVRLLDSMTKQPLVANKIKLAKRYVILSFTHLSATIVGTAALLVVDGSATCATVFFEALFFLGSVMHVRFFFFRKDYAGEAPGRENRGKRLRLRPRPRVLIEPAQTCLVIARRRES